METSGHPIAREAISGNRRRIVRWRPTCSSASAFRQTRVPARSARAGPNHCSWSRRSPQRPESNPEQEARSNGCTPGSPRRPASGQLPLPDVVRPGPRMQLKDPKGLPRPLPAVGPTWPCSLRDSVSSGTWPGSGSRPGAPAPGTMHRSPPWPRFGNAAYGHGTLFASPRSSTLSPPNIVGTLVLVPAT